MTAEPAATSSVPVFDSIRSAPRRTTVNSSNSGVWPGSTQPAGLVMRATLRASVFEFTRPMNSSIFFGGWPAAVMMDGEAMRVGMARKIGKAGKIKLRNGRIVRGDYFESEAVGYEISRRL